MPNSHSSLSSASTMTNTTTTTSPKPTSELEKASIKTIPRIPINPLNNKLAIGIRLSVMFITTCIVPEVIWFSLHYATHFKTTNVVAISGAIFGAPAFFQYFIRLWQLTRKDPDSRPLGLENNRKALDFFQWNYSLGIVYITALTSIGSALNPPLVRLIGISLPALMVQVGGQMALVALLRLVGVKTAPFRISSHAKGSPLPSAVHTIVEDIVAVDAQQGLAFRKVWNAREQNSPAFAKLMRRLDVVWGLPALLLGVGMILIAWLVPNESVGWALGWSVPWIYASTLSIITYSMVKTMQREEQSLGYQVV